MKKCGCCYPHFEGLVCKDFIINCISWDELHYKCSCRICCLFTPSSDQTCGIVVTFLCLQMVLMPGHYAVFRMFVEVPKTEGIVMSHVFINTQFEHLVIPAVMTVAHGHLEVVPESVVFDKCFPVSTVCDCMK